MSEGIKTSNPYLKGIIFTAAVLSYAYYISWFGEKLNGVLPEHNIGYIVTALIPFIVGIIIHVTGLYRFYFKVQRKKTVINVVNEHTAQDDPYGVAFPIYEYKNILENILKSISDTHFTINDFLLVSLYTHGLAKVKNRFWTTTYLTSGFWAHGRTDVINANKEMLNRLFFNDKSSIRRIFLLRSSIDDEIKSIGVKIAQYKSHGEKGAEKIKQMIDEFENLIAVCTAFSNKHCEIKYYFDEVDRKSIGIIKNNTEIAMYDDFRVDYFDGGDDAKITGIRTYTEKHKKYAERKEELTSYFETIWNKSTDIKILLDRFNKAYKYYSDKIDYTYPKLIKFDSDLNLYDKKLKEDEFSCLTQFLEENKLINSIKNYLDIGTCTGRYPFALSSKLSNATILAIDADEDCIEYCNIHKVKNAVNVNVDKIVFNKADFLHDSVSSKKYDLITCMLGTISHFGWNKIESFEDDLQLSITKMNELLADNGILVISNWSEFGLNSHMLDIYDAEDRIKLQKFTEKTDILKQRLNSHFDTIELPNTNINLDILVCRKKTSK